jgi:hypothetical protein
MSLGFLDRVSTACDASTHALLLVPDRLRKSCIETLKHERPYKQVLEPQLIFLHVGTDAYLQLLHINFIAGFPFNV